MPFVMSGRFPDVVIRGIKQSKQGYTAMDVLWNQEL